MIYGFKCQTSNSKVYKLKIYAKLVEFSKSKIILNIVLYIVLGLY
jgi:hypothetical protein